MDTERRLKDLIDHLSQQEYLAVDTESDSLYSYFEKVCLVQLSTASADYIVDPLAIDISPLGLILADPTVQKVLHAAEYDVMTLRRDYGFQICNLFDTMLAARILGWPKYGLSHLLKTHFKVILDKKFQQYDWGKRPLSREALDYARLDTHYLLSLRDIQRRALQQRRRLQEATEAFERVTQAQSPVKIFDPADFWQIKGVKHLSARQQARLQALYVFRDRLARQVDRPPFKVMNAATMLQLARHNPKTLSALRNSKGVSQSFAGRYGRRVLEALRSAPPQPTPRPNMAHAKPSEDILRRYEHLRRWRSQVARARGVEPDVVLANEVLRSIAETNPQTQADLDDLGVMGAWQRQTYGASLLEHLKKRAAS